MNIFVKISFIVIIALFGVFGYSMLKGESRPYHVVPSFSQQSLLDFDVGYTEHTFRDQWTILHVWASWCTNCAQEQPVWRKIKKSWPGALYGLNFKDGFEPAREWLVEHGNLFDDHFYDPTGELANGLKITGTPETLVINPNGGVDFHFKGIMTVDMFEKDILPLIGDNNVDSA